MFIKKIIRYFISKRKFLKKYKNKKSNCFKKNINLSVIFWKKTKKIQLENKNILKQEYNRLLEIYYARENYYYSQQEFQELKQLVKSFKEKYVSAKYFLNEKTEYENLLTQYDTFVNHEEFNKLFLDKKISSLPKNFFKFNNIVLDQQQVYSILKEDKINLVIAGAGSGKTTTILGKIKYLIEECNVKNEQILVLSYSRKSVSDFNDRIKKYLPYPIFAKTIHSFSNSISTQVLNKKSSVADENNQKEFFKECINNGLKSGEFRKLWFYFVTYYLNDKISNEEIDSILKGEEIEQVNGNIKFLTLKGEKVKSLQELKIANFLFLNGIDYEYEKKYEYDTASENYSQYRPDFYLKKYNIYWEHFGLNKNGDTKWKNTNSELDKIYKEGIKWKIKVHNENETQLIQTFSYEFLDYDWEQNLKNKLQQYGVILEPEMLDEKKLIEIIKENKTYDYASLLFQNLISLYEENGLCKEDLLKKIFIQKKSVFSNRIEVILKIFFNILDNYFLYLEKENFITFSQMVKNGKENLKKYNNKYKYLIIDEFQDISPLRMNLINELIIENNIQKFYFVGDDWQSIYRFSGSRVELFTSLLTNKNTSVTFINNTYRNSQQLIDITSNYIEKDKSMIKKNLKSFKKNESPIIIYEYKVIEKYPIFSNQAEIIARLINKHYYENANYTFLILARTNISKKQLLKSDFFYQKNKGEVTIFLKSLPEAKIKFLAVHSSKGLEADFVFLMDVSDYIYGMPCKIINDPIYNFFDGTTNEIIENEERRIFYVALTRTKNTSYLLTEQGNHSSFVEEILQFNNVKIILEKEKTVDNFNIKNCPICHIKIKINDFFIYCPNYKYCGVSIKNSDISERNRVCKYCGWIMILKGNKKLFYLCTNFNCRKKEFLDNILKTKKYWDKLLVKQCNECYLSVEVNDFFICCPNYKYCGRKLILSKFNTTNRKCFSCGWIMTLEKGRTLFYVCNNENCGKIVNKKWISNNC